MDETILVTGATGTVGSEVVKLLSRGGISARAALHSGTRKELIAGPRVSFVDMDYHQGDTIERAMDGIEHVMLILPVTPDMEEITHLVVEKAQRAGVRHIVKLSALGTGPDASITLGRLHYRTEEIIRSSGIGFTFLRPTFFMQNFVTHFGAGIRSQGVIYFPGGDGRTGFIDVRDIAAVAVKALTSEGHRGKAYPLTGPELLSFDDAAKTLSAVTGDRIVYVNVTDEKARLSMKSHGMSDWLIDGLSELYAALRAGYMTEMTSLVKEITGREPRSLWQFVEDHMAALRREKSGVTS